MLAGNPSNTGKACPLEHCCPLLRETWLR